MSRVDIFSGIVQAVIIVIPVWITVSVFLLKRMPIPYDRFGIFFASIMSIGFWQIIRMMNIITEYISPTDAGSPGDASIRLILRLDEFLIMSWFLILSLAYLTVADEIVEHISTYIGIKNELEEDYRKRWLFVTAGYLLWFGLVLTIAIVLSWIGEAIIS